MDTVKNFVFNLKLIIFDCIIKIITYGNNFGVK